MTVTLDNKKIYEETDDNVELSVWDNRLSSKMSVFLVFLSSKLLPRLSWYKVTKNENYENFHVGSVLRIDFRKEVRSAFDEVFITYRNILC